MELKIEYLPTGDLIPYARNSRTHTDEQVAQVAASIREFGFASPILIDEDKTIIAGHCRVMAAQKLGLETVPTVTATGWTEAQKRAYVIVDNRLAENAGWDADMLKTEFADLDDLGFDLSLLGFDESEIDDLLADDDQTEPLTDPDEIPEPEETPVTRTGDIWTLCNHRLMCGDSTNGADVALLMDGERADMVFTDPPYGVAYKVKASASDNNAISEARKRGCKNETIANDDTLEQAYEIARNAMQNIVYIPIKYVCCDWKSYPTMKKAVEEAGIVQKALIVWDKGGPYQNLDLFAKRHEFIIYAGEYGGKKTVDTDIWYYPREFRADHPTPKPVKLVAHAIECHDNINIVLDLFGGSGTTLIAAETTGRKCRMMELAPNYCDVIIQRWQNLTGKQAMMDGKTYEQLREERNGVSSA